MLKYLFTGHVDEGWGRTDLAIMSGGLTLYTIYKEGGMDANISR